MKYTRNEASDTDDSEAVDDPNPVPLVENIHLDKSGKDKNSSDSSEENRIQGNERISYDSNNCLNSGGNSLDKSSRKKPQRSSGANKAAKNKSSGNVTSDVQVTFDEDLLSDDEVYIFHCPENFKKHNLLNKIIDISKSNQVVCIEGCEKYQLEILNSTNKQVTLAVPQKSSTGRLFNLPLKGHMVIQKIVDMESNQMSNLNEVEDEVVFPSDIKVRHPFLGVNWKPYIDSANEMIEKNQIIKKMKKKIKKDKIDKCMDAENGKLKRKASSEITSPKKHKKKA